MSQDNARGERLQIMLTPEELQVLDDFRFKQRMPSRAAAVRELLKRGLAAEGFATAAFGTKSSDYGVIGKVLGDGSGARQQLDAADRLDAESPLTPVARTAIAIQDYRADEAIRGAREALARFQARGGIYSSLSENRFTGSYAAQAFRFAGLDEWARFYGDRVFDSYTASSYFDQALARTPDPSVPSAAAAMSADRR